MKRGRRDRFKHVEIRLEDWAEWLVQDIPGLGYGSRTVEGRLMEEGAGATIHTAFTERWPRYEGSPRNAETHRAYLDLGDEGWQRLVFGYYVLALRGEQLRKHCKYPSRQRMADEMVCALAFLDGRLGGSYRAK